MYNEEQFIARCLSALRKQEYPPHRYEVIVVDGLSTDRSREIVEEIGRHWPNLRLISNPQRVIPSGLNIGLKEARGEIIVRVDAHTVVATDYISTCVRYLQSGGADNVGGLMRPVGEGYVGSAIAFAMASPFGPGPGKFHYFDRQAYVDTVYLGAYYRNTLLGLGGWDTEMLFSEDDELNFRLRQSGGKILLVPEIRSTYYCRNSLQGLASQYFNYGRFKVRVLIKHRRLASYRHFVPVVFVAAVVGGAVLNPFSLLLRLIWLLILGIYCMVNVAVSFTLAARYGWRHLFILPAVFSTLHLSYGLGFWRG